MSPPNFMRDKGLFIIAQKLGRASQIKSYSYLEAPIYLSKEWSIEQVISYQKQDEIESNLLCN